MKIIDEFNEEKEDHSGDGFLKEPLTDYDNKHGE